jgi:hypothetical protein
VKTNGHRHYVELSLPIEPFREWLHEQCRRVQLRNDVDFEHSKSYVAFACGMSPKRISEYLESPDRTRVTLSTVDRVLSRNGGAHVRDLYGFEYETIPLSHRRLVKCGRCGSELVDAEPLCGFCVEELETKGLAA